MMPEYSLDHYLTNLLERAARQMHRQLEERFSAEGIPVEQWRILELLADDNGLSMGQLARSVMMNLPTLTKTIDRMVSANLVHRKPDAKDRRKVLIYATARGKALSRRLTGLATAHQDQVLAKYGLRDARQLRRLLEDLIENTR